MASTPQLYTSEIQSVQVFFIFCHDRLAKNINVPPRRINEIVHGKRSISADTALRLARYFGLSERFWMNIQSRYDLEVEKDNLDGRLEQEVLVHKIANV